MYWCSYGDTMYGSLICNSITSISYPLISHVVHEMRLWKGSYLCIWKLGFRTKGEWYHPCWICMHVNLYSDDKATTSSRLTPRLTATTQLPMRPFSIFQYSNKSLLPVSTLTILSPSPTVLDKGMHIFTPVHTSDKFGLSFPLWCLNYSGLINFAVCESCLFVTGNS